MRPVLTAEEYRRVDQAYEGNMNEAMDRAGHAVALAAVRAGAGYGKTVAVLAGPGNNGGDGYVAARYLKSRGAMVKVHALGKPKTELAREAAAQAEGVGVATEALGPPVTVDLIIDALFGGRMRSPVGIDVAAWMKSEVPVISVDFPTGLDPDTGIVEEIAFRAAETVTFSTLKTGHVRGNGPDHCGVITVADIGINGGEPSMFIAEEIDAPRPGRRRTAHKWSAGSVLVLGGSKGMIGAVAHTGKAALRFGAGSVAVAAPDVDAIQQAAPELVAHTFEEALRSLPRFDVVIAGPGLADEDVESVRPLVAQARRVILDAGGLTRSLVETAKHDDSEVIVTPHDAEFARIAGVDAGAYSVRAFAASAGVTVLRKGNPTMISDGDLPILVATGGAELASIGTGDVLAGMVGALMARGLSPMEAAVSGAYWHGVAGATLAAKETVTAPGLIQQIGNYAW